MNKWKENTRKLKKRKSKLKKLKLMDSKLRKSNQNINLPTRTKLIAIFLNMFSFLMPIMMKAKAKILDKLNQDQDLLIIQKKGSSMEN